MSTYASSFYSWNAPEVQPGHYLCVVFIMWVHHKSTPGVNYSWFLLNSQLLNSSTVCHWARATSMAGSFLFIVVFPLLPISCLTFAGIVAPMHDKPPSLILTSFVIVAVLAFLTLTATVHHLCKDEVRQKQKHFYILLPLSLSLCAFSLCIVSFIFYRKNNYFSAHWFSWILTFPLSLLALGFSLATSVMVYRDMKNRVQPEPGSPGQNKVQP